MTIRYNGIGTWALGPYVYGTDWKSPSGVSYLRSVFYRPTFGQEHRNANWPKATQEQVRDLVKVIFKVKKRGEDIK